ncbi:MAG: nuclear transport factor 2 family protein [Xanthomonadales bacterium]|nr:nuclear transport factor 2 family protein [Xanthomonadales bacterium]
MTQQPDSPSGAASPEALLEAFVDALAANDADRVAACYANDAVCFAMDEMVGLGPEFVRESWNAFFSVYTVREVRLTNTRLECFGDTAAAWGLFQMLVDTVDEAEEIELHGRFTDVAKQFNQRWLFIADHASVPLPPE